MGPIKLSNAVRQRISIAMFVVAAVMLVDGAHQVSCHASWRNWIPESPAAAAPTTQPADTQPTSAASRPQPASPPPVAAAIKRRNIMTAPLPKGHGMKLTGVLGKVALFTTREGKTVGIDEGKAAHGVKVDSINGFDVTIEYEGKTETIKLFPPKPGPTPAPPASMPTSTPGAPDKPLGVEAKPQTGPAGTTSETKPASQPAGVKP